MNFKRLLTFFCLLFLATSVAFAQSGKLKRAKQMMKDLDYVGSITLYNQILEGEDNSEAKINIAECYRKINDWVNAEFWYGQVVRLPEAQAIHKLYYGESLQRNGKCDLAKEWYEKYVKEAPDDLRGQYLVKACDYEDELMTKNAGIYEVKHMDFNSNLDDFGPAIYKNGVVFASERDKGSAVKRQHSWTGNPFLELYYVDAKSVTGKSDTGCNFLYSRPEKFSSTLNSKYHDASVTFNNEQNQIFFTRNNYLNGKTGKSDDGIVKLKVYFAKGNGSGWSDIESLPFNSEEYSTAHPTLSTDGKKLYFSSDMPGGFGGMDLYVSEQENGRWGPPMNLGPQINTEGHEVFPYFHKSNRLYFSSDGHIGLGGLDLYYMDEKAPGQWGEIINIGSPINTVSDDFGVVMNDEGTCGYFSSDRTGGAGRDDIYSFKKTAIPVEIYVFDKDTNLPIEGAEITNNCTTGKSSIKTGKDGKARFDMKIGECCTYSASKETYKKGDKEGCTKDLKESKLVVEIPLEKEQSFTLDGVVFDQSSGLPLSGALLVLTNDCGQKSDTLTTDNTGKYIFNLKKDCCYKVKAEKANYLAAFAEKLCAKSPDTTKLQANLTLQPLLENTLVDRTTTTQPSTTQPTTTTQQPTKTTKTTKDVAAADKPTSVYYDSALGEYIDPKTNKPANGERAGIKYKKGQIVESKSPIFDKSPTPPVGDGGSISYLLHIYYDFDQSYIRDEAQPELEKLLRMLNENPTFIIELASHTDSRGSNSYNNRLSQRRAEAVVRWLVKNGIDRDRLVPRGYGETVNVNNCSNNVPCSEREHQLNRRTEFRVLGCKGCIDDASARLSKPNENPKVSNCQGCPF